MEDQVYESMRKIYMKFKGIGFDTELKYNVIKVLPFDPYQVDDPPNLYMTVQQLLWSYLPKENHAAMIYFIDYVLSTVNISAEIDFNLFQNTLDQHRGRMK